MTGIRKKVNLPNINLSNNIEFVLFCLWKFSKTVSQYYHVAWRQMNPSFYILDTWSDDDSPYLKSSFELL